jgi:hypothetical protein
MYGFTAFTVRLKCTFHIVLKNANRENGSGFIITTGHHTGGFVKGPKFRTAKVGVEEQKMKTVRRKIHRVGS